MTDIQQALEWAERMGKIEGLMPGHRAAVEIIQSLPDQWVDAEKVAELADDMSNWRLPDLPSTTEIDYRRLVEIMDGFTGRINDLLAPPLPRPEDVPAGKPWLVKHDGHEWVGTRDSKVEIACSWALARLDGADYTVARDDEITLVSRLVPEVKL